MPKPLKKQFYFMSPVQVVKVTTHNIEQAAEWCGGEIKTTDSRRYPGRKDKYIDVPVPKGAALVMAFPGMYITKRIVISLEDEIKVTFAVFRRDYFEKNYFLEPVQGVDACWVRLANEEMEPEKAVVHVQVSNPGEVGKALMAARSKMLQEAVPAAVADGVIEELINAVAEDLSDTVLTPAQQRMLITGDAVEAGTNPETGNVILPRDAAAAHPTQRAQRAKEKAGEILDPNDPALYVDTFKVPVAQGDVHDPFKLAGSSHDPMNVLGGPVTDDNLSTPLEDPNATQEIAGEPATIGEELNQAGVGSASRHRAGLAGEASAEGRSDLEKVADEAAYRAEMKAIEEGNPDR